MTTSRTASGLLLAATLALLSAAPAAAEEALVPPENSAVNQYTETFPTAGGDKDAHDHDGGNRTPKKVLGHKNAKKLEEQGPAGKATAELAAETAPNSVDAPLEAEPEEAAAEAGESEGSGAGAPSRGDGGGNAGNAGNERRDTAPSASAAPAKVVVAEPNGSSGFSEVLGKATGSSQPGGMGIFLPLLILGTIFWAIAYVARQRRPLS